MNGDRQIIITAKPTDLPPHRLSCTWCVCTEAEVEVELEECKDYCNEEVNAGNWLYAKIVIHKLLTPKPKT